MIKRKLGRNDPCWCGSGKKYKNCHLRRDEHPPQASDIGPTEDVLGEFGVKSMQQTIRMMVENPNEFEESRKRAEAIIQKVQEEKRLNKRIPPSQRCVFGGSSLPEETRAKILDIVASIADDNRAGRSEMCIYFAVLLRDALNRLDIPAKAVYGKATYFNSKDSTKKFTWDHGWVVSDDEIIDGNIDSIVENPLIPPELGLKPLSFWGKWDEIPGDRIFEEEKEISEEWENKNMEIGELSRWRNKLTKEMGRTEKITPRNAPGLP